MIDWSLGLELAYDDNDLIELAFSNCDDYQQSLNQSMSYIHHFPLITDFEIKKSNSNRDPQVQLAIWATASLLKKRKHKWDRSMPMPAIAVYGHDWKYCIFFELDGDVVCPILLPFDALC